MNTTSKFRIPKRVTSKFVIDTVNQILKTQPSRTYAFIVDEKQAGPFFCTKVEPYGPWHTSREKSEASWGATQRSYKVTIENESGASFNKSVEITRGGGMHRFHLCYGGHK